MTPQTGVPCSHLDLPERAVSPVVPSAVVTASAQRTDDLLRSVDGKDARRLCQRVCLIHTCPTCST